MGIAAVASSVYATGNQLSGVPAATTYGSMGFTRSIDRRIMFRPAATERCYGFTGQLALAMIFGRGLLDDTAELTSRDSWHGLLIHRHANDTLVPAMSYWQLRRASEAGVTLVRGEHVDTLVCTRGAFGDLTDVIETIAHATAGPLTAVSNYSASTQHLPPRFAGFDAPA